MWLRQTFIEIYKAIRHPVYRSHPRIGSGLTLRFHEYRGRAEVYSTPRISAIFLLNSIGKWCHETSRIHPLARTGLGYFGSLYINTLSARHLALSPPGRRLIRLERATLCLRPELHNGSGRSSYEIQQ